MLTFERVDSSLIDLAEREEWWQNKFSYCINPPGVPHGEVALGYLNWRSQCLEAEYRKEYIVVEGVSLRVIGAPKKKNKR